MDDFHVVISFVVEPGCIVGAAVAISAFQQIHAPVAVEQL
jgi:uncharacterized protein YwlG (UPF0340 family)